MKITILNKRDARIYQPEGKALVIRLDDVFPMKPLKGNYFKEARFYFHDIPCGSELSIQEEHAEKLVNFIKNNIRDVDEVVVHCVHGQGRSPAIAFVIAEYVGVFLNKTHYPNYNKCVYGMLKSFLINS